METCLDCLYHANLIKEKDAKIAQLESLISDLSLDYQLAVQVAVEREYRIKELKTQLGLSKREKLVAINSLNELNRHLSNEEHVDSSWIKDVIEVQSSSYVETIKERKKYQEAVKDIDMITREVLSKSPFLYLQTLFGRIRLKYGLNKQESES